MILEANHISYTYRTQKKSALYCTKISAGFEAGKFYSIIGSSGSGKIHLSLPSCRTGYS